MGSPKINALAILTFNFKYLNAASRFPLPPPATSLRKGSGAKWRLQLWKSAASSRLQEGRWRGALSQLITVKLDAVSALPSEYPGWMLERQGAGRIPAPFAQKS